MKLQRESPSRPPARAAARERRRRWLIRSALAGVGSTLLLGLWLLGAPMQKPALAPVVVNDVTGLNPIAVTGIAYPQSVAEVQRIVVTHPGPIAIGGGHYSMGGQTACVGCLSLDMRKLDHVLDLDVAHKRVRVEAGITWRKLQNAIDPHGLAVSIMQTYANFTVGGALSVNAHGRYVGGGPVVRSVAEIELVLADGSLVRASPDERSDLFYAAIGGYGGLGVIVTATLNLADNARIQRHDVTLPLAEYEKYFQREVRNNPKVIFHNGDLYPPDFEAVHAQSWALTDKPLTVKDRFTHSEAPGRIGRGMLYWVTELPFGHAARRYLYDAWVFSDEPVVLRNHEASYDVIELEPESRLESTYVLQEYFVPVAKLSAFVPKLRDVLTRHHVKTVNVSIRHALPDPGTLLAWAPEEVFSFVLYYKQETSEAARERVRTWTREAVDAVLSVGGRYYLPYQPHATQVQFRRAYPGFDKIVALKKRVDPQYRFRNMLWQTYLPPQDDIAKARAYVAAHPEAQRNEGQTFLTLPEWYIVFSAEEYQRHLARSAPSSFPYFGTIGQFWSLYRKVIGRTRGTYPPNSEYHVMNVVIGTSFSIENAIKGVYENTFGRFSEWFACDGEFSNCNAEDAFAAEVARDYDTFIRTYPWYEFPFAQKLSALWKLDTSHNPSWLRGTERRMYLSAEYGLKAIYAWLIGTASHSAYGVEEQTTRVWATRSGDAAWPAGVRASTSYGREALLDVPRYEGFRDAVRALDAEHVVLRSVAGNERIALTIVVPSTFAFRPQDGERTLRWPVLTDPAVQRVLLFMKVERLLPTLADLQRRGARIDHVFDF